MFLGTRDMNSRINWCQVWFKLSTDTSPTTISADLAWSRCLNFWAGSGITINERLQLQIGLPDKVRLESEKLQLIRTASTMFRDASNSPGVPFHTEHIKAARSIVRISAKAQTKCSGWSIVSMHSMHCFVNPFLIIFETSLEASRLSSNRTLRWLNRSHPQQKGSSLQSSDYINPRELGCHYRIDVMPV